MYKYKCYPIEKIMTSNRDFQHHSFPENKKLQISEKQFNKVVHETTPTRQNTLINTLNTLKTENIRSNLNSCWLSSFHR